MLAACGALGHDSAKPAGLTTEEVEEAAIPLSTAMPACTLAATRRTDEGSSHPQDVGSPLWTTPGLSLLGVVGPSGAVAAESALDVIETIEELVP